MSRVVVVGSGLGVAFKDGTIAFVLVEESDHELLVERRWTISGRGYVRDSRGRLLHREVLGMPSGDDRPVHHRNAIKFDNRRENLLVCSDRRDHGQQDHRLHPTFEERRDFYGAGLEGFIRASFRSVSWDDGTVRV